MGPRARIAAVIGAIALAGWIGHRSARPETSSAPRVAATTTASVKSRSSVTAMQVAPRPVMVVHTPAAAAPVPEEPPLPTAEQVDAADTARAILDAAVARGAWTEDDWTGLDAVMGKMTLEQRGQALRDVSGAVNEGRMSIAPRSLGS